MKKFISIATIFLLSFLCSLEAHAGTVGSFTRVEGRVDITSPGSEARPAKVGDGVLEKDIIRAKSGSKAEIIFKDGNVLRLAQNTRVEVAEYIVKDE